MATYKSIAYDQALANPSAMVLLEEQTASSDDTISFTSGIDSTYGEYIFEYVSIHPETDNTNFSFQADTGTNTSYNQTMMTNFFRAVHSEADDDPSLAYVTSYDQHQGTAFQILLAGIGNDNDQSGSGFLHLYSPSSTTFVKMFYGRGNSLIESDQTYDNLVAGYFNTTTAITRVQFKMSSDAIDAGTIKLYGVN
tara:strand:+ start:108 stop:692 length:585 start_codon:yes stop_codon:yes gene_type:complete